MVEYLGYNDNRSPQRRNGGPIANWAYKHSSMWLTYARLVRDLMKNTADHILQKANTN